MKPQLLRNKQQIFDWIQFESKITVNSKVKALSHYTRIRMYDMIRAQTQVDVRNEKAPLNSREAV